MTTPQFVLFLAGLAVPMIYQRLKFALNRRSFERTALRERSGLNLHHGHWGFVLAFIAMNLMAFGVHNSVSIGLAGFGWGLMLDEIIPMLMMPSPGRKLELDIYERSTKATIILVGIVVSLAVFCFFLKS